jgi:hypothetical protein
MQRLVTRLMTCACEAGPIQARHSRTGALLLTAPAPVHQTGIREATRAAAEAPFTSGIGNDASFRSGGRWPASAPLPDGAPAYRRPSPPVPVPRKAAADPASSWPRADERSSCQSRLQTGYPGETEAPRPEAAEFSRPGYGAGHAEIVATKPPSAPSDPGSPPQPAGSGAESVRVCAVPGFPPPLTYGHATTRGSPPAPGPLARQAGCTGGA